MDLQISPLALRPVVAPVERDLKLRSATAAANEAAVSGDMDEDHFVGKGELIEGHPADMAAGQRAAVDVKRLQAVTA